MELSNVAQYDLTDKICLYLDPHMIQILLIWLKENEVYQNSDIDANMNLINEIQEKEIVHIENEFTNGNRGVISNFLYSLEMEIGNFSDVMNEYRNSQADKMGILSEKKSIPALREWSVANMPERDDTFNFPNNVDEQILKLSRYYYQKRDYLKSKQYLLLYILNVSETITNISDSPKIKICYWGIISNIINTTFQIIDEDDKVFMMKGDDRIINDDLMSEISVCIETIVKLSQLLTKEKLGKNEVILQRSWLIHWSLFLIFHFFFFMIHIKNVYPRGHVFSMLQDWFIDEKNLAIVSLICPHIIRYYCVYAIFNRHRKDHFDFIVSNLRMFKAKYNDPFTSLLTSIFVDYNFNVAQTCITKIGTICSRDAFLFKLRNHIEEQCRFIIFETYCRIHKSINIEMIASKVNLPTIAAEKWIVNLIRNAKLDAKIDSEKNCIDVQSSPPNLYQQIVDKTQNIIMRSNFLVQHLNKPTDDLFQKNNRFKNKLDKGKNLKKNRAFRAMYGADMEIMAAEF